jgi:hypothetical protein
MRIGLCRRFGACFVVWPCRLSSCLSYRVSNNQPNQPGDARRPKYAQNTPNHLADHAAACKLTAQRRPVCTKPVSSTPTPRPACAPLQVEETNPRNAHQSRTPIGCSLLRFKLLSAHLSESRPCHLVTLIEPSKTRLRFARLDERHDIGAEVGVIAAIFEVGTMWRL